MKRQLFVSLALLAVGLVFFAQPVRAQDYSKIRIVRLSLVEGGVQYRQPGGDWQDAGMNLPIQEGFALRTADGYAEVEFENSLTMRLGTNSTVEFSVLALSGGGRITQLTVSQGTAIISAKLTRQDEVSLTAAKFNVQVPRHARFRVDVTAAESWVTVFDGKVELNPGSGTPSLLGGGRTLHEDSSGSGSPEIARNPPQDEFDKWVSHREDAVNAAQNETSGVLNTKNYTEGFADLYAYGLWSDIAGYGMGWMPYGVGAGWMPFVNGQWQFMGGTGWNWVSQEPWGWMPYHFGSWVNAPGIGWAWLPIGATSWVPATANWVQTNNQLGWTPIGPPLTSKPTKTQQAAIPTAVILAGHGPSGTIAAGERVPLARGGMSVRAVAAPTPASNASTQAATPANGVARPNAFVGTSSGVPASLRAPNISLAQIRLTRLSSAPPALLAPHSMAAGAVMRAVSAGGSRGGFDGARMGGGAGGISAGPGTASPANSSTRGTTGSTSGSASHSGGSVGSSGPRR